MRVFLTILVFFGLNLSPSASAGWGDWKNKISDAVQVAKESCEAAVTTATEAAAKTVDSAMEGGDALLNGFRNFVDSLPVEGVVDGVSGGAAGLKSLLWDRLSLWEAGKMGYRIFRFNPDVEGLREGMFGPMTEFIDRLRVTLKECETLPRNESTQKKVEIYGDFMKLLLEMTLKSYKMIPQIVVEIVPSALGSVLVIVQPKAPESLDQLVVYVTRQFLVNAFKAATTPKLNLEQRFALLSERMAMIEAGGQFANDAGITDFLEALKRFRETGPPPPALPPPLPG